MSREMSTWGRSIVVLFWRAPLFRLFALTHYTLPVIRFKNLKTRWRHICTIALFEFLAASHTTTRLKIFPPIIRASIIISLTSILVSINQISIPKKPDRIKHLISVDKQTTSTINNYDRLRKTTRNHSWDHGELAPSTVWIQKYLFSIVESNHEKGSSEGWDQVSNLR